LVKNFEPQGNEGVKITGTIKPASEKSVLTLKLPQSKKKINKEFQSNFFVQDTL